MHCIGPLPVQCLPRVVSQTPIGCAGSMLVAALATKHSLSTALKFFFIEAATSAIASLDILGRLSPDRRSGKAWKVRIHLMEDE